MTRIVLIVLVVLAALSGRAHAEGRGWFCSQFIGHHGVDGFCERDQTKCLDELSNLTAAEIKDGKKLHVIGDACAPRSRAYLVSYYMGSGTTGVLVEAAFPALHACKLYLADVQESTYPITKHCEVSR